MSTRTIQQIESEIQAMKDANPNWTTNSGVMALITALTNEKNNLFLPPQGIVPFSSVSLYCFVVLYHSAPPSSSFCGIIFWFPRFGTRG